MDKWAFGLTLTGVSITLYQLFRTGRIVLWTRRAVEQTLTQVNVYSLLTLLPDLHLIEHRLDVAIQERDAIAARRLVLEWKLRAADLRGLVDNFSLVSPDLEGWVSKSLMSVTLAKGRIDKSRDASEATAVLSNVSRVCTEVRTIAAYVKAHPPEASQSGVAADFRELYFPERWTQKIGKGSVKK